MGMGLWEASRRTDAIRLIAEEPLIVCNAPVSSGSLAQSSEKCFINS